MAKSARSQRGTSRRTSEAEVTFFKSVGVAVQDVAVADLVLKRAIELGLGQEVEL